MAKIDLKFAKGNKQTLKAMSTTYRDHKKSTTSKSKTTKK